MGFVWLIRLHLNRTVKFLSCEKASKVSPQSTGETGGVEVSCVCSALAQVQLHVPGAPAVPEPARNQAWHCLAQVGNRLGLICLCTRRVCVSWHQASEQLFEGRVVVCTL